MAELNNICPVCKGEMFGCNKYCCLACAKKDNEK